MTKKDLFDGLNYIDESIVDEAAPEITYYVRAYNVKNNSADAGNENIENMQSSRESGFDNKYYKNNKNRKPARHRIIRAAKAVTAAAAVLVVAVLGTEVVRLNNRINELETIASNATAQKNAQNNVYAGIKGTDRLGSYALAANYEELYDTVKKAEDEMSTDISYEYAMSDGAQNGGPMNEGAAKLEDEAADTAGYSTTNVMTEGVDESDIVKTDGKFIYMVEDGQLSITDISAGQPGAETIFRPDFAAPSDTIEELYVSDGNMLVISNHRDDDGNDQTICYSYDIADPTKPALIGKAQQDGYFNTSRKIGSMVYIFSDTRVRTSDMKKNQALQEDNLDKWVPQVNGKIISYDCIYIGEDTYSGTVISSFDVGSPEKTIDAKCIMNDGGEVYVSADSMYFYTIDWSGYRAITRISRIAFEDGRMTTGESTSVNGRINDKFAINQQGDYLYVLPTSSNDGIDVNSLHVFDMDMKEVGAINEIARGESIYAARFLGKYVYFITYEQTDPLFVADISDPTNPKILGELEVSGFSEYLHIWDDTHVLGIGYGDSAMNTIKLTMFDVSNPAKPVEENQKIISGYGYYCEGMYDYKAVLADPKKNLIGFSADNYYLFSYDKDSGFNLVNEEPLEFENHDGYRGIYKDNDFYVAGNGEIKYFNLSDN